MKAITQFSSSTKEIKKIMLVVCLVMLAFHTGCGDNAVVSRHEASDTNDIMEDYYEMKDGTWEADGVTYKYRLELRGTMPNAAGESCFVVLTNDKDISFDEVAKSLYSSNSEDWLEETRIVEMY